MGSNLGRVLGTEITIGLRDAVRKCPPIPPLAKCLWLGYTGPMSQDLSEAQRSLAANAIRALAIDGVNRANSGHPGAPMGLADIAVVLWAEVMRFDPTAPDWIDRDRFVLSNGHASMLQYAVLHLAGYDLSIEDLKNFRQLHSRTPGHPEYGYTVGVETTTGPLGQGFANGVGMALAARMARGRFGGRGFEPVDHTIWGICGDGCLMEGVSAEAASFAGHQKLGEIVYVYDDNSITIDGDTSIAFTEDVQKRFEAYGWHTLRVDGHDQAAIKEALLAGKAERDRPTLISARTHIGYGSPNRQDTSGAHGAPLGEEEAALAKAQLGWAHPPFEIPDEVRKVFAVQAGAGKTARLAWEKDLAEWKAREPELGASFEAHFSGQVPDDVYKDALAAVGEGKQATRALSGQALNGLKTRVPQLVGGSADLAGSNKTTLKDEAHVSPECLDGRNIHFGVREHGMGAIVNGMALWGGFIPYGATFLTFSDYMRPAIRLAALMKIRALSVFTHESIYLGEDGPTHQSVEHAWALRMIPGLYLWRPADGVETAMAWSYAVSQGEPRPHALLFTRQGLEPIPRAEGFDPKAIWRGAYVARDVDAPDVNLIATGSEVELALGVSAALEGSIKARVISMPCVELFLAQDEAYQREILPEGTPRVAMEIGRTGPWDSITNGGLAVGLDRFGESAPIVDLKRHFGFGVDAVAEKVRAYLAR